MSPIMLMLMVQLMLVLMLMLGQSISFSCGGAVGPSVCQPDNA